MVERFFQYSHRNSDTAVPLKVVVGGVRYRAQKSGNQIPTVKCVPSDSANKRSPSEEGVVWLHNLAKLKFLF